jgi:L-ascorbate metabolism protein UlaG (beta-lactamase superfamily)
LFPVKDVPYCFHDYTEFAIDQQWFADNRVKYILSWGYSDYFYDRGSRVIKMHITYRWLGVAGLEFRCDGFNLLVDPFFTRPGKVAILTGRRVQSNAELVARHIAHADAVLVSHPHYDHLLDVPEVLRRTGARAFGSPNTALLLNIQGIPSSQVDIIQLGDRFNAGPFSVEVCPGNHTRIPLSRWYNGSLPAKLNNGPQRNSLRLSDYRMDICYSFTVRVADRVLQIGKYPSKAEVLFASPFNPDQLLYNVLRAVQPRWFVPIHWDDFTRPLTLPLRPTLITPAQGLRPFFPPVRRLNLRAFAMELERSLPGTQVRIPEIFQTYPILD